MTFLPSRTLLMFDSGVTIRIDGHNGPCRIAGGEIARHVGDARQNGVSVGKPEEDFDWTRTDMAQNFVEAARMKRGLVAWVEREGVVKPGEGVTVRIWEHWVY